MIENFFDNLDSFNFIFLSLSCFAAAFIDAIAGGGGLISLPAFMSVGLSPHLALGTNKLAAFFSSSGSAFNFFKSGKTDWFLVKYLIPFSFLGAILGVVTVVHISPNFLYPISIFLLIFVLIYTLINKKLGIENFFTGITSKNLKKGMFFAFLLGFYDGFFGPGTGSFIIFALIKIFKFDFVRASGNAKFLNLSSNIASVISFIYFGKIAYFYSLSMGIIMILGASIGAKTAVNKGTHFIRPVFLIITSIVLIKMILKFFNLGI